MHTPLFPSGASSWPQGASKGVGCPYLVLHVDMIDGEVKELEANSHCVHQTDCEVRFLCSIEQPQATAMTYNIGLIEALIKKKKNTAHIPVAQAPPGPSP